jgi:ATP-binding cassette subfamily B protein
MRILGRLGPYFRHHPLKLALGIGAIAVSVALGLLAPLIIGRAIDTFREEVSMAHLLSYGGLLLGVTAVQGLFSFAQRMTLVALSRDIELDLRNDYFAHLETLPLAFYHRQPVGDLMARATNDLQAVRMLCGPAIMYSTNTLLTAIGTLVLMSRIHWQLTLLALATMPLVAVATTVFGRRIHHLFERVQEQFSSLSSRVQENLAGVRVVRAYVQERAERAAFDASSDEYVDRNRRLVLWTASFHPLLQALVGVGFVLVLWRGIGLVTGGRISVGEFVSFNFFLAELVWPMIAIGWVINLVQRGSASLGRIVEVMDTRAQIRDEPPFARRGADRGEIRCRNLWFRYSDDTPRVLEGIDFSLEPGQTLALVGRTGAGKSTLLSLVPRLLDPPPGTLFLDGADVRRLPLAELRASVAVVPQETFLFSATLRDNVLVGRPDADHAAVGRAVAAAGLGADLELFPDGLDTVIGERGITLSGGQKQRVALARALLKPSSVLVLDDCFSAVDTETEERILSGLAAVLGTRTTFLVSHRVSTVKRADLILVLDRGTVVERGSHEELLALGGLYSDLERRQRLEEELAAV